MSDLIDELQRQFDSHLFADLAGWDFAASYGDMMSGISAEAYLNVNRDTKVQPKQGDLLHPWPSEARADAVSPEELARLKASLLARSAFRSDQ